MDKIDIATNTAEIIAYLFKEKPDGAQFCVFLKKGKYKLSLSIPKNSNDGFLDVKENSYLCFSDGFLDFSVRTKDFHKKGLAISTGSDGLFEVKYSILPVSEIGPDPYPKLFNQAKKFIKENKLNKRNKRKYVKLFLKKVHYPEIESLLEEEE